MEWTFSDSVRLSLLSFSEASKACAALPGFSLFRRSLQPERIEYCRAELLPDCLVGSLAVPDKTHPLHLAFSLRFISTGGSLFWQPTNRHFRLCRASSSRKNRSILPMSSTCFSRFWNR